REAGEGERVGVQNPLQAIGGEAEGVLDRGQGDVDDRDVENDHELPKADEQEQRVGVAPHDLFARGDRVHRRTASRMYAASKTAANRVSVKRRAPSVIAGAVSGGLVSGMRELSGVRSIVRQASYHKFDTRRIIPR